MEKKGMSEGMRAALVVVAVLAGLVFSWAGVKYWKSEEKMQVLLKSQQAYYEAYEAARARQELEDSQKRIQKSKDETKAYVKHLRETMKSILPPAEYAAYIEKSDRDDQIRLQEEQLKELREIKEKLGK